MKNVFIVTIEWRAGYYEDVDASKIIGVCSSKESADLLKSEALNRGIMKGRDNASIEIEEYEVDKVID